MTVFTVFKVSAVSLISRFHIGCLVASAMFLCTNAVQAQSADNVVSVDFSLEPIVTQQSLDTNTSTGKSEASSYVHYGQIALINPKNLGDHSNISVIVGDDSIAVIDSGGSAYVARDLLPAIRQISDKPIKYLILTHAHPDHWMGSGEILKQTNATLVVHGHLPNVLIRRAQIDVNNQQLALDSKANTSDLQALLELAQKAESSAMKIAEPTPLDLGNRVLTLFPTTNPMHTDHDLLVVDEKAKLLWSGDLLFVNHVPTFETDIRETLKIADFLTGLAARYQIVKIIPGHGPIVTEKTKLIKRQNGYYQTLVADLRTQIAKNVSLGEALAKGQAEAEQGKIPWELAKTYHPRNISRGYDILEWE